MDKNKGYGFVEFDNPEIAKAIVDNCNGKTIPNTNKLFKLNWASHGSGKNMTNSQNYNNNNNNNINNSISNNSNNSNNSNSSSIINNNINMTNSPDYSVNINN